MLADLGERLTDYSLLSATTVERAIEKEDDAKVLTLKCTYFESPEDLQNNCPKEIEFWTYRDKAMALAQLIFKIARPVASRN